MWNVKKQTETNNEQLFTARNGRLMQKGICSVCEKMKTKFVKTGNGLFNEAVNKLPFELQWVSSFLTAHQHIIGYSVPRKAFELHLPGHNFTGPGTRLGKRLNPDLTPKEWSKPINKVDNAAYHHDLCYTKHQDRKARNEICDKKNASWVRWDGKPDSQRKIR